MSKSRRKKKRLFPLFAVLYVIGLSILFCGTLLIISAGQTQSDMKHAVVESSQAETKEMDESKYEISPDGKYISVYLPLTNSENHKWTFGSSNEYCLKAVSSEPYSLSGFEDDSVKMTFEAVDETIGDVVLTFECLESLQSKPDSKLRLSLHVDETEGITVR